MEEAAMSIRNLVGALVVASLGLGTVGCDQSKAELDSTKQQLQSAQAERDSLKTQLDQTKQQLAAVQQQLDQMKAAQAAPPPSGAAATPEPKKETKHHASKSNGKTATQVKAAEQKKVNTGATHMDQ
jgi:septal ring factor EnvC (AmiA/AmiB activator)